MEKEKIIKLRDCFREMANLIDEMIELDVKEENGEDVTKEAESLLGRYMIKAMEMESLK